MLYRDDLYQATRRVEELEAQLASAREDRDALRRKDTPVSLAAPERPVHDRPGAHEWWPMLIVAVGTILYFAYFRVRLDDFDLPLEIILPSTILGSAIYSLDVVMRWLNGNRSTVWCRLAIIGGVIAGAPALLAGLMGVFGLMSIVMPIAAGCYGLGCLVQWIRRG